MEYKIYVWLWTEENGWNWERLEQIEVNKYALPEQGVIHDGQLYVVMEE